MKKINRCWDRTAFLCAGGPWSSARIVTKVSAREKKIAPRAREAGIDTVVSKEMLFHI